MVENDEEINISKCSEKNVTQCLKLSSIFDNKQAKDLKFKESIWSGLIDLIPIELLEYTLDLKTSSCTNKKPTLKTLKQFSNETYVLIDRLRVLMLVMFMENGKEWQRKFQAEIQEIENLLQYCPMPYVQSLFLRAGCRGIQFACYAFMLGYFSQIIDFHYNLSKYIEYISQFFFIEFEKVGIGCKPVLLNFIAAYINRFLVYAHDKLYSSPQLMVFTDKEINLIQIFRHSGQQSFFQEYVHGTYVLCESLMQTGNYEKAFKTSLTFTSVYSEIWDTRLYLQNIDSFCGEYFVSNNQVGLTDSFDASDKAYTQFQPLLELNNKGFLSSKIQNIPDEYVCNYYNIENKYALAFISGASPKILLYWFIFKIIAICEKSKSLYQNSNIQECIFDEIIMSTDLLYSNYLNLSLFMLLKTYRVKRGIFQQCQVQQLQNTFQNISQAQRVANYNYTQFLFATQTFSSGIADLDTRLFSESPFVQNTLIKHDMQKFIINLEQFSVMYNELACVRKWQNVSNLEEMQLIKVSWECMKQYLDQMTSLPRFYEEIFLLPEIVYIASAGMNLLSYPGLSDDEKKKYAKDDTSFYMQYQLLRLRMIRTRRSVQQLTGDELCTFFNLERQRALDLGIIDYHFFEILPNLNQNSLLTKLAVQYVLVQYSFINDNMTHVLAVLQYTTILWKTAFGFIISSHNFGYCKIEKVKYQVLTTSISLFSKENQEMEKGYLAQKFLEVMPEINDYYLRKSLRHFRKVILNQGQNSQENRDDIMHLLSGAIFNRLESGVMYMKEEIGDNLKAVHLLQIQIIQEVLQGKNLLDNQILFSSFESVERKMVEYLRKYPFYNKSQISVEKDAICKASLQVLEDYDQSINYAVLEVLLHLLDKYSEDNFEEHIILLIQILQSKIQFKTKFLNLLSKFVHAHQSTQNSVYSCEFLQTIQSYGINIQQLVLQNIDTTFQNTPVQIQSVQQLLSLLQDDEFIQARALEVLFSNYSQNIAVLPWKNWVTILQRGLLQTFCENQVVTDFVFQNNDLVDLLLKNATNEDILLIVSKVSEYKNGRKIWNIVNRVESTLFSQDNYISIFKTTQFLNPRWDDFASLTAAFIQNCENFIRIEDLQDIVNFTSLQQDANKKLLLLQFGEKISNLAIQSAQKIQLFDYAIYLKDNMQQQKMNVSYATIESVIISCENLGYQSNEILTFTHGALLKLYQQDSFVLKEHNQVDLLNKIFGIYLQCNIGEQQLLWFADIFIFHSHLDNLLKTQVLLPRLNEVYNKQQSECILNFVEKVLNLAICDGGNFNLVHSVVKNVQKQKNDWKLPQPVLIYVIVNLLEDGNFSKCWDLVLQHPTVFSECSVDQATEIALFLDNKLKINESNQNFLFLLQENMLNDDDVQIKHRNDRICNYTAYWFKNNNEENGLKILHYFTNNNDNISSEVLIEFLNSMLQQEFNIVDQFLERIPEQIIEQLSENFELLVSKLYPMTIETLVCNYDQFCLQGYEYLRQHYKRQVSSQVWKIALIAAKNKLDFYKGYSILKSIEPKTGEQFFEWQLNSKELIECEFYFNLYGNDDSLSAYNILQKWYDLIGTPPSQEILATLLEQFERDPYNSGKFVDEMLFEMNKQDPKWPQANAEIYKRQLSVLMQSPTVHKSMSQAVAMQLQIVVRDNLLLKNCDKNSVVELLEQCFGIDLQFLGVLFVIMICNGVFSDAIVDAVESDEGTSKFLSDIFGVSSIMDSIYAEVDLRKVLKRKDSKKIQKILLEQLEQFV